jgi:hypothetical protein
MFYLEQPNAVTLRLGRQQVAMLDDAKHLARTSDRFNALLAINIPEGQPRILSLSMVHYIGMSIYINFINFRILDTTNLIGLGRMPPPYRGKIYDYMAQLYFVGPQLGDRTFSSAVMREILRIFDSCKTAADGAVPGRPDYRDHVQKHTTDGRGPSSIGGPVHEL